MDLKLFLDPVSEDVLGTDLPDNSIQKSIFLNHNELPDLEGMDIVILGLTDHRQVSGEINSTASSEIRKKFYSYFKTSGKNRVADLGDLRNGPTAEETVKRLEEVLAHIMSLGLIPVLIGGTQDMTLGQYGAFETMDRLITLLNVDSSLDLHEENGPANSFLTRVFKHDPNFLFNYIHLGYQAYLVDDKDLSMLDRLFFEAYRLGQFRDDFKLVEPVVREADMITFDCSAIQSSYCPETTRSNVFGFSGEEACQIAWYAGHNDKLSSIGFYNYVPGANPGHETQSVIATMMWYFIDGFYHRKGDKNFMSNDYLIYEVAMGGDPGSIRFYKSKLSEKWWMEVPDESSDSIFLRNKMVPCGYEDYELAQKGEVPQRWVTALAKMS